MCKVIEYKLVEGFEDYMVSSDGKVWSLKYGKIKELKLPHSSTGYTHVALYKNNERADMDVHVLVLSAFVERPSANHEVDHINAIRDDNRLENLHWVLRKENLNNPRRREAVSKALTNHPAKSTPVVCLETGEEYPSVHEASRQTGIHQRSISSCINGKRKSAGGFHWAKFVKGENPIYE